MNGYNDKTEEQTSFVSAGLFNKYPDVVTVKELQSMLRLSRTQTYTLIHRGAIQYFTVGTSIRIAKPDVIRFVKGCQSVHKEV